MYFRWIFYKTNRPNFFLRPANEEQPVFKNLFENEVTLVKDNIKRRVLFQRMYSILRNFFDNAYLLPIF